MVQTELLLDSEDSKASDIFDLDAFKQFVKDFNEFDKETQVVPVEQESGETIDYYVNEFWASKQRAGSRLHEVSYRACFKPQLPAFFIDKLTRKGETVYDPFMGRGTSLLESALHERVPLGCDISPLSEILLEPRLNPPTFEAVEKRLEQIDFYQSKIAREDLLTFYHRETLGEISSLRDYFLEKEKSGKLDIVDKWIRMVATNRLTGHSTGFFSVYSLPPNQAVTIKSQEKINEKRAQVPPYRNVPAIILKKSKQLLKYSEAEGDALKTVSKKGRIIIGSCDKTKKIRSNSVSLVVTSPPFLTEVDYATDNWLRCWFNGIDESNIPIWIIRKPEMWQEKMTDVFTELRRVVKPGGYIAFEVGEVRKGKIKLEDYAIPAGVAAGLQPALVLINDQKFTKTSNCWGVSNQSKGTNTNRIILFRKPI